MQVPTSNYRGKNTQIYFIQNVYYNQTVCKNLEGPFEPIGITTGRYDKIIEVMCLSNDFFA